MVYVWDGVSSVLVPINHGFHLFMQFLVVNWFNNLYWLTFWKSWHWLFIFSFSIFLNINCAKHTTLFWLLLFLFVFINLNLFHFHFFYSFQWSWKPFFIWLLPPFVAAEHGFFVLEVACCFWDEKPWLFEVAAASLFAENAGQIWIFLLIYQRQPSFVHIQEIRNFRRPHIKVAEISAVLLKCFVFHHSTQLLGSWKRLSAFLLFNVILYIGLLNLQVSHSFHGLFSLLFALDGFAASIEAQILKNNLKIFN